NSIYHSLQVSAVRRFSGGVSLPGAYTFSKIIDKTATPINSYADNRIERGMSSFDRTHIFLGSYVWELPPALRARGWRRQARHGWQISGITSLQSGNPLTPGISGDRAGTGGGGQRPNLTGPVTRLITLARWFNTDAFAVPALGAFGNAGRALVRGPGINDWDVSFSKRTELREKMALQFRAEFFNLFNHAQFSAVRTPVRSPPFCQLG